jgi:hypothetical protein
MKKEKNTSSMMTKQKKVPCRQWRNQKFLINGQTSLVSEKTVGKMGRIFIDGPNKILIM